MNEYIACKMEKSETGIVEDKECQRLCSYRKYFSKYPSMFHMLLGLFLSLFVLVVFLLLLAVTVLQLPVLMSYKSDDQQKTEENQKELGVAGDKADTFSAKGPILGKLSRWMVISIFIVLLGWVGSVVNHLLCSLQNII